jgi:hypothetical protein
MFYNRTLVIKERSMTQDHSLFVSQIADAMRPLIGVVDPAEIQQHGLDAAHSVYDQLLHQRHLGNGVPDPAVMTRGQATAEAFMLACKQLNLLPVEKTEDAVLLVASPPSSPRTAEELIAIARNYATLKQALLHDDVP